MEIEINMIKIFLLYIIKLIANVRRWFWTWIIRNTANCCGDNLTVNYKSFVTSNTLLGNNVNFNGMRIKGTGRVTIGDNFHSGQGCKMITNNHDYDNDTYIPYGYNEIIKEIYIEDNVWLGDDVLILGGVTIGEGAIIQAGSCVVWNIPAGAIAGGRPANVFGYRNMEHYNDLKEKKRFL